jgi:hypothetical protein
MISPRFVAILALTALALANCSNPDPSAPTTPAVAMPDLEAAIANSTPEVASRGMSNKTWLWTRGGGPAQIHYSTFDGRDYVWVVGQRRIFVGEWRIAQDPNARGRTITKICLRYPGAGVPGLSESWTCPEAGRLFYEMTERESGDPLRINGRTEALFLLERTPASLAEVQARVRQ